jgi:hypothetical protein
VASCLDEVASVKGFQIGLDGQLGELSFDTGGLKPRLSGQWAEVLVHLVENRLSRHEEQRGFVEDALSGSAHGRREEDVSVGGDAS